MTMRWKYFQLARGLRSPDEDSGAVEPGTETGQSGGPLTQSSTGSDAPETPETPAPEVTQQQSTESSSGEDPPKKAWYYDRIDKLTRRLRETEEAAAAERARREALERGGTTPPPAETSPDLSTGVSGQPIGEPEIQRMVAQRLEAQRFNERANAVWEEGQRTLPGFTENVVSLQQMAGGQIPMAFVSAVLELDEPAKVLNALAQKPDMAYELMFEANPTRQVARLTKFEVGLKPQPPKVSSAPPPVVPKATSNTQRTDPTEYDTDLPIGEWMKLRSRS